MKNYILTVMGSFDSEESCKELAISLTPIVDSPNLKFQHTKGTMIFHFATEVSKEEIFDYVGGILYGVTEAYILTELNDQVTVSMPSDIKQHLLDLENGSDNIEMFIDMRLEKNNLRYNDEEQEDDDDFVALLLDEVKRKVKKPSLDQILEKISKNGIESLSNFEKETLEYYSENY
jgi:hypothetical protein